MRNLNEFPITKEELLFYCKKQIENILQEKKYGDMRPLYYDIIEDLITSFYEQEEFLEE